MKLPIIANAVLLLSILMPLTATAGPMTWYVQGAFGNNQNFSGSFEYDPDSQLVTTFDIAGDVIPTLSAGPQGSCDAYFNCSFGGYMPSSANFQFEMDNFGSFWYEGILILDPSAPLTDAGGSISLTNQSEWEWSDQGSPFESVPVLSGTLSAAPDPVSTPEPAASSYLALACAGFVALQIRCRLRHRTLLGGAGLH